MRVGVSNLNMFPNDDGVSKVLSPLTIVTGKGKIDYNKLKIEPGTYAQVTVEASPSNGMTR